MTVPLCQCYVDELSVQRYFGDPIRSDYILWAKLERTRGKGYVYNSRFPVRIPRRCGYRQLRCARPSACEPVRANPIVVDEIGLCIISRNRRHISFVKKEIKRGSTADGTIGIQRVGFRNFQTEFTWRIAYCQSKTRRLHDPVPAVIRSFNFLTTITVTSNTIVL